MLPAKQQLQEHEHEAHYFKFDLHRKQPPRKLEEDELQRVLGTTVTVYAWILVLPWICAITKKFG